MKKHLSFTLIALLLSLATFATSSITGTKTLCVGSSTTLRDSTTGGLWYSGDTIVASITLTGGVVTAISPGTAVISYTAGGSTVTTTVTVYPLPSVILGPSVVCVGSTITLTDATPGGIWTSGSTTIAVVTATGVVTGIASGGVNIYYTSSMGCSVSHSMTVTTGSTISGPSTVCVGSAITLSDATPGGVWSSSNTTRATVSGGVVTGISSGVVTISYTAGSCSAVHSVTVTGGGTTITGPSTVCVGATINLMDSTSGGIWISSDTSKAYVSSSGAVTGLSVGVVTISYYVGGCIATHSVTVTTSTSVIGGPSTVCLGSTITLSDATPGGSWTSSSPTVATVGSSNGIVTGLSLGVTTITYKLTSGCYATHVVTVTSGSTISGPSTVCVGSMIVLSDAVTGGVWSSSNTTRATVSGGVVTGVSSGVVTISYTAGGCSATHSVTVIGGTTITGPSSVCVGSTINLMDSTTGGIWISGDTTKASVSSSGVVTGLSAGTVTISYYVGGCIATHVVTVTSSSPIGGPSVVCVGSTITLSDAAPGGIWSSSSPTIASVGTVTGVVTGNSAGVATITYTLASGCKATHIVTVSPASVIGGLGSVCVGSTISLTDAYSGGTWSSSNTSRATVNSVGIVTGISGGVVTISYAVGGCLSTHTVTVVGGSTISGPSTVCVGATISLTDSTAGGFWISSDTSKAFVSSGGIVTGLSTGVVTISYYIGSCVATHTVTVTAGSPIGGLSTVCVGSTITLTDAVAGGTWSSSNTSKATVSIAGVVTGISSGVVTISYKLPTGCYATHTVTVSNASSISGPSTVCIGSAISLTDSTTGGIWISSDTSKARVSTGGIVTGVSAGVVTISYYIGGCVATHTVTVVSTTTISGPSTVCVGSTITLSDGTPGGTWFSSSTAIATVSSTGVVTGISHGSVTIYYLIGTSCYATHGVTVTSGSVISGSSTLCTGSTAVLSDATPGGVWSSSNTTKATVSTSGVVTGISAGTAIISYSVGGCVATHTVTITGGSSISGPSVVCIGSTITLTDSTTGGVWLTSNTAIARVGSSNGIVTGVSAGTCTIYYVVGGCYAFKTITVTSGASPISGPSTLCVGSTITLSDASPGGIWSSSNTTKATVSSGGVVTGISAGTAIISYSVGGTACISTHMVTISGGSTISGSSTVCVGSSIALSDSTTGGTWASGNASIATVSSSGIVTGVSAGVTIISYSVGGCIATHTVTVTGASVISGPSTVCVGSTIALTDSTLGGSWLSSNTSIATVSATGGVVTGISTGTCTIYYVVGGCYSYKIITVTKLSPISGVKTVCVGSTTALSDSTVGGTWHSSVSTVATISSTGVVTGLSAGTTIITYTAGGCSVTTIVTVTAAPAPIAGMSTVCVGSSITLSDATPGGAWSTAGSSVATISSTGVLTGIAPGSVTVLYTVGSCSVSTIVTVSSGAMPISGPSTVCAGSTIVLTDSTSGGHWSSSNASIASVGSSNGIVTGISTGVVTITYSSGGCAAYKSITVTSTSTISGPSTVCIGSTISLSDATPGGSWSSSGAAASVSSAGVVTGLSAGVVTISYSVGTSCFATHVVTVTSGVTISGPSIVCIGSTITLSTTTGGGAWISGDTTKATVSSSGVVTGMSTGVLNIYYSAGGCYGYHTVTVTGASTISGPSTVCTSSTINLSDATAGGVWSSSNPSIASVGASSGVVTGITGGVVTITYSVGSCPAYHTVTVTGTAPITGPSTVTVGGTIILSDATPGGVWFSSNTSIATVSSSGVVVGTGIGIMNVYYVIGGCGSFHTVNVTAAAPGGIKGGVVTGGAKGTSETMPVVGLQINLQDAENNIITYTNTDNAGNYSFNSLPEGDYIVYPQDNAFTTTPAPAITISSTSGIVNGINFREDNSTMTIVPYSTTNVTSVSGNGSLHIYPNPTNGELNMNWANQLTGSATVVIADVVGREVYRSVVDMNTTSGTVKLALTGLHTGVYLITIKSDNIYYSGKLMIQQ